MSDKDGITGPDLLPATVVTALMVALTSGAPHTAAEALLGAREVDPELADTLVATVRSDRPPAEIAIAIGDVIRSHPTHASERAIAPHPSLKPQSFLRQIVRASLPLGEGVVLDPFAGSGSTLAAAQALGYACIGLERDPVYVRLAKKAIPKLAALAVKEDR